MIKLLLCLSLLLPSYSFATECKESVQVLEEGKPAPCSGLLYSPDAAKNANQAHKDAKHYKELSELLHKRSELTNKEIEILDQRLKLYQDSTQALAEQVTRKNSEDFWQKTFYFGLGVAVTGLAIYAAAEAIK